MLDFFWRKPTLQNGGNRKIEPKKTKNYYIMSGPDPAILGPRLGVNIFLEICQDIRFRVSDNFLEKTFFCGL